MDFGDLILFTLKLLRERPNLLAKYQEYFSHILVDEFQDTNYAQFELIKLLSPPANKPPLTVVGDDDQSVYKFRGASIANVLDFKLAYPQAHEIVLTDNYRSNQAILDAAYHVITHNNPNRLEVKLGIDKKLKSRSKADGETTPELPLFDHPQPAIMEFATLDEEIEWTAHQIVDLVTQFHLTYKDIAILTRANSHLENYAATLKNYGIPYQLISNRGLFDQEEIVNLIHFLHVLVNPDDSLALFPITQLPLFQCDPHQIFTLMSHANRKSTSLWQEMSASNEESHQKCIETIKTYQVLAATQTVRQVLYQFVLDTGYIDQFLKVESLENQLKLKNLNLFFAKIKQFEVVNLDRSIISFLNTLDLWLEAGENPGQAQIEDIDTVKLMTVHAAKGLEFAAVFVGSLVAGHFPSNNKRDPIEVPDELIKETLPEGDMHLEEERRLFYVALTRAKHYLYLTYALDHGGARPRKPSGFLNETEIELQKPKPSSTLIPLIPAKKSPLIQTIEGGQYQIFQVSYSKLDTFKTCPLRFKYRYLLQIPAKPHHSLAFGQSIHTALYLFHSQEMAGAKPTKDDLLHFYEANFIKEGYESAEHKRLRFESGQKALERYYNHYREVMGVPVMLEQMFKLKVGDVTVLGKIDRIDKNTAGEYEIIDYKTGVPKDQKAVDRDEQLTIYALASNETFKFNPKSLSLYFLEENGGKVSTSRTAKQLENAKAKLLQQIKELKESTFPAKPSEFACRYCEYVRLCPFAVRK